MKNQDVKHYRFLERAIKIQEKIIDRIREQNEISDRVLASDTQYPFTEKHVRISAPTKQPELERAEAELRRLIALKNQIESIPKQLNDPTDKKIITLSMSGKSNTEIARIIGCNQSTISRKISAILAAFCD